MEPKIIYQDKSLFVVDKPSGWITNEADTTTNQPVLQTWMLTNFKYPISNDQLLRSGIVHRLDKETSGILIVAKTKESFEKLQAEFKRRRDRFGVLPGGREATTLYKVIKFYPGNNGGHTLVEFKPKTGRTHQIRIHAKHIGHAIVGDEFYAGRKTARNDRRWCPRLFLHAASIKFIHPETKKTIEFKSALPEDLQNVLNTLEK